MTVKLAEVPAPSPPEQPAPEPSPAPQPDPKGPETPDNPDRPEPAIPPGGRLAVERRRDHLDLSVIRARPEGGPKGIPGDRFGDENTCHASALPG